MPLHALLRTHLRYIRPRRRLGWEVSELVPVHRRVEPAFRGTERDDAHRGTQEVRHTRLRQGRDGNLRAGVRAELQENRVHPSTKLATIIHQTSFHVEIYLHV